MKMPNVIALYTEQQTSATASRWCKWLFDSCIVAYCKILSKFLKMCFVLFFVFEHCLGNKWLKFCFSLVSPLCNSLSSQMCAHQVVCSVHIYVTVQQCFAVCCCSQAQPCMKSTKTRWLCLLCVTVCVAASEPFSHCESCSTVLSVSTTPAERQPSVHTLRLHSNP